MVVVILHRKSKALFFSKVPDKKVEKVWLKNGDPGNNLTEMGLNHFIDRAIVLFVSNLNVFHTD